MIGESPRAQARALATARDGAGGVSRVTGAGDALDRRAVPLLRLILSAAALLIVYIDPSELDRHVLLAYTTLGLYTLYSAVVYLAASAGARSLPTATAHWIDLAWYTALVPVSGGTSSPFFFLYFFAILVASFRWGASEGLSVTVASALSFTAVALVFAPAGAFSLHRLLLRPVYLLVFGCMVAHWGDLENRSRRRFGLLKEVAVPVNPQFGAHQTISAALEKLRQFYLADSCLLVLADTTEPERWLYQARRGEGDSAHDPVSCPPEMAAVLLSVPYSQAMLVNRQHALPGHRGTVHLQDVVTREVVREVAGELSGPTRIVVDTLDADAVVTVPFRYHHDAVGRLYLTGRTGTFDVSDLDFLAYTIDATMRVADNIRLVDRAVTHAADDERRRVARAIHDTVIQPYVGLQIGLGAILHRVRDGTNVEADLERLLALIDIELGRLRNYVKDLKREPEARATLMLAIRRFADQFSETSGIDVRVNGAAQLLVNEWIAGELFDMTVEALSNVRRHTAARSASVSVVRDGGSITLRVENEGGPSPAPRFSPRSLEEHARVLGGTVDIQRVACATAVVINIPL